MDGGYGLDECMRFMQSFEADGCHIFDPHTWTVTYVVYEKPGSACAIIDSVLDYDPKSGRTSHASADQVIAYVQQAKLKVDWLLETHAHADHLSAAPYLKQKLGGRIAIGRGICAVQSVFKQVFNAADMDTSGADFDQLFDDAEVFNVGSLEMTAMHTPGHTPACMAFVIGDAVFVGDTLFMPDYGTARCDFPGGDARQLFQSLRRILSLPATTRLFMCHDYLPAGRTEYAWETTVEAERTGNVHAHDGITEDEFVAMREARDATLDMPRLILPSVQVNMRAGHMPAADDNGITYLKIPVNAV